MRKKGNVKWFNNNKGYGFLTSEKGIDFFVHHTNIDMPGYRTLEVSAPVEFEIEDTPKGPQAVRVKCLTQ